MIKLVGIFSLVVIMLTTGFYFYYKDTQNKIYVLAQNNAKIQIALEQEKQTLQSVQESYKQQTSSLLNLANQNTELSAEKDRLVSKLVKHDLEELSRQKPILVETRINNATKNLFNSFISITTK